MSLCCQTNMHGRNSLWQPIVQYSIDEKVRYRFIETLIHIQDWRFFLPFIRAYGVFLFFVDKEGTL